MKYIHMIFQYWRCEFMMAAKAIKLFSDTNIIFLKFYDSIFRVLNFLFWKDLKFSDMLQK